MLYLFNSFITSCILIGNTPKFISTIYIYIYINKVNGNTITIRIINVHSPTKIHIKNKYLFIVFILRYKNSKFTSSKYIKSHNLKSDAAYDKVAITTTGWIP